MESKCGNKSNMSLTLQQALKSSQPDSAYLFLTSTPCMIAAIVLLSYPTDIFPPGQLVLRSVAGQSLQAEGLHPWLILAYIVHKHKVRNPHALQKEWWLMHEAGDWHTSGSCFPVPPRGHVGGGEARSAAIWRPTLKLLKCSAN